MFKEFGCIIIIMDKNFHNVSMFSHEQNYKENKLKELKIQLSVSEVAIFLNPPPVQCCTYSA